MKKVNLTRKNDNLKQYKINVYGESQIGRHNTINKNEVVDFDNTERVMWERIDNDKNEVKLPWCGFCKYATNRREWEDKIYYGDNRYDIAYCEEITCVKDGSKYHPMQCGCDGEYYEQI